MLIEASRYYELGLILCAISGITACTVNDYRGNCDPVATTPQGGMRNAGGGGNGGTTSGGGKTSGDAGKTSSKGGNGVGGADGAITGGADGGGDTFACAGKQPPSRNITDFGNLVPDPLVDGQFQFTTVLPGSTFSYPGSLVTLSNDGMALNASGNINEASGFGIYLSSCIDASAITAGVAFSLKGTVGESGTLSFRVLTSATTAVDVTNKRGSCDDMGLPASCRAASFDIPISANGGEVTVRWSDLAGGVPVDGVDGTDVLGFEWAFAYDGATAYDAEVTLDDLRFVSE